MKKLLSILLALSLMFCLASCTKPETESWSLRREKATDADAALPAAEDSYTTLRTSCGEIKGLKHSGYSEFRGVRYATAERWEEAVPVDRWEGVYDATAWGDRSCQHKGYFGVEDSAVSQFYANEGLITFPADYSEDSLNLNIWTPENAKKCPVLVYIHGGSFLTGSNSDTSTDGEAYAHKGIVTVSINYRLGPLATAYGDGYLGNLALTDQLTALRWVRDHISDFGGDPSRITVMGESAGAVSVQNLLVSPLVEDNLISGAIMMSCGGALNDLNTPTQPGQVQPIWDTLKSNLGVDSIADLKDLPAAELYTAWCAALGGFSGTATTPVVNGESLTCDVRDALQSGSVKDVPCIIGFLSEDMYPYSLYSAAMEYGVQRDAAGGKPVYSYYFDRQLPGENEFGAFHAGDLWYAFGTLYRNWRPFDDIDYRISEDMIDYLSNFVKTGDPNGDGLPVWESVRADNQRCLNFGDAEPAMCAPSTQTLLNTQMTRPAFPYWTSPEVPADKGEKIKISPDDLAGIWNITGFTVTADGSFTEVVNQIFDFSDTELHYTIEGAEASACYYTFQDEYNIALKNFTAAESDPALIWTLYLNDEGQLLIEDPTYNIIYVCVKQS